MTSLHSPPIQTADGSETVSKHSKSRAKRRRVRAKLDGVFCRGFIVIPARHCEFARQLPQSNFHDSSLVAVEVFASVPLHLFDEAGGQVPDFVFFH
jgi:hypothetical protein